MPLGPVRHRLPRWLDVVGVGNLVLTLVLVPVGVLVVLEPFNDGGPVTVVLVALAVMTLLAFRRAPAISAVLAAVLVLVVQLVAGPLVTCAAIFPVMCAMAYQLAAHAAGTSLVVGAAGLIGLGVVEVMLDPALGLGAGIFIFGVLAAFAFAGVLLRSRARLAETLRQRTVELTQQRERTAELAIAADRTRIGSDLDAAIGPHLRSIAAAADTGRQTVAQDRAAETVAALAQVEAEGRETLAGMRRVVGMVQDAPTTPLPGIGDLDDLLHRATVGDARLTVVGPPRPYSPYVELCAYRIVEQLLATLSDLPRAQIDVVVRFEPGCLRITLGGPSAESTAMPREPNLVAARSERAVMVQVALEAARARAAAVGGTVVASSPAGWREINVVLPAVSAGR
ncbi:MAG TPA: hypothetical protein VFR40_05060 [Lapillicoccus sp.]|nr:hypothetical protein [Lapillicoccus sp.]